MTIDFSKIIDHPDREEIISKLITGINPKDVSDWLKLKYPKDEEKHLHVPIKLLKDFKDGHMDLYSDFKNDVAKVASGQQAGISKALRNNKTYQERISEIASNEIDIKKLLANMIIVGTDRLEQLFDKIQQDPMSHKGDYALLKWYEGLSKLIDQWGKLVLNTPDQVIQHNVTIEKVEEYSFILQDVVRETLAEVDPDIAYLCMEKLNARFAKMKPENIQEQAPLEKRLSDVKVLSAKLQNIIDGDIDVSK